MMLAAFDSIASEAVLDGIYIVRTPVPTTEIDSADCVRHYKSLANVERVFRTMKTIDLKVGPIHHRLADLVRAHIFLCMLAYYVEWHLRETWRELLLADEDQAAKQIRDPVARATRSDAAKAKKRPCTRSTTAPPRTALPPCSPNSRPSCATPAGAAGESESGGLPGHHLAKFQTTARSN